jgi:hypothetical protein
VGLDPVALKAGRKEGTVKSKGVKQRVHEVSEGELHPETSASLGSSHIWVRESAPAAVRAVVRAEAEREGLVVGTAPHAGPGASGGRSTARSGAALGSGPKIHSSAPWLSSGSKKPASGVRSGTSSAAPAAAASGAASGATAAAAAAYKKPAKARLRDAPGGWMQSDDYATLTF